MSFLPNGEFALASDQVFQKSKDQEADAILPGAQWVSNEYTYSVSAGALGHTNWTITAGMRDQDILSSADGWWGKLEKQGNDAGEKPKAVRNAE